MRDLIIIFIAAVSAFAQSTFIMVASFTAGALFILAVVAVTALVFRPFSRNAQKHRRLATTAKAVHRDGKEKAQ